MRKISLAAILIAAHALASCGVVNMDLFTGKRDKQAIPLIAQPVATPPGVAGGNGNGGSGGNGSGTGGNNAGSPPAHSLFDLKPGTQVPMSRYFGAIDPVGTSLPNDFDGDGILNSNETITNIWVADYPRIESSITTPVSMKIEIREISTGKTDTIGSDITSDDVEKTKNEGSDNIQREETNTRTAQYQAQLERTTDGGIKNHYVGRQATRRLSVSESKFVGAMSMSLGGLDNYCPTAHKCGMSISTSVWKDQPFLNHMDKDETRIKSDTATKNAHKVRNEIRSLDTTQKEIKSDAGVVRAAFYIRNETVNMPVRLSDILVSLVFEKANGQIIPMQTVLLRNEDFTPFAVDVYGGTEFGPYVIELKNLNTVEVKNALEKGYTPKVIVVDYKMTHVQDSNYRSTLVNFQGDNLKIVEENSKARTALIKIFGPNLRRLFRVAAFSTDGTSGDPCSGDQGTTVAPGISLWDALRRISCSGTNFETGDYVIDLSDTIPNLPEGKFHVKGLKSVAGIPSTLPCVDETHTGSDGVTRTACVQKPIADWTPEEIQNAGVWVIFPKGKYYANSEFIEDAGVTRTFNSPGPNEIPIKMVKGIDGIVWAGDHYDIAYLRYRDYIPSTGGPIVNPDPTTPDPPQRHGTNPLETGDPFTLNTRWNKSTIGTKSFDPDNNSTYLGTAGFGEQIILRFKLTDNQYLAPDFGPGAGVTGGTAYTSFAYDPGVKADRFSVDQVADFEISLGFGGNRTDWLHVRRDIDAGDPTKLDTCGTTLDYVTQEFLVCIRLPTQHPYVDTGISTMQVYMRTALNSAYRETVWPLAYNEVRKFRGTLNAPVLTGANQVLISSAIGQLEVGDELYIGNDANAYTVSGVSESSGIYTVDLSNTLMADHAADEPIHVQGNLTEPTMDIVADTNFVANYNLDSFGNPVTTPALWAEWDTERTLSMLTDNSYACGVNDFHGARCLGYETDYVPANWMGSYNFGVPLWNARMDGGDFSNFLTQGLPAHTSTAGTSMGIKVRSADQALSTLNTATQSDAFVAVAGTRAITVWASDSNGANSEIRARVVDVNTGDSITTSDIQISTSNTGNQYWPHVAASGNRALVVWSSTDNGSDADIRGRIVDLNTGAAVGTDFLISSSNTRDQHGARVTMSGSRALVVWESTHVNAAYRNVRGRVVDVAAGTALGAGDFLVDATAEDIGRIVIASNASTTALVGWQQNVAGTWSIRYSTIDFSVDTPTIPAATNATTNGVRPEVAVSGNYGIVVYDGEQTDWEVRLRIIDMSNGSMGTELQANTHTDGHQETPTVAIVGSKAFIAWETWGSEVLDIRGRFLDLATGQFQGNDFLVATSSANTQTVPRASAGGDRVLVVWRSDHVDGAQEKIMGRLMDMNANQMIGSADIEISSVSAPDVFWPQLAFDGRRGLVVWSSDLLTTGDLDIRGRMVDSLVTFPLKHGLNNFFVAPLIERTYEVRATFKELSILNQ